MQLHQIATALALHAAVCQLLWASAQPCPAPFRLEAGKCVFVSTAHSHTWCSANRHCESIGGELLNSHSSLKLLGSMPSVSCSCNIWLGVSDLAEERVTSRSGWQRVNGNGQLPKDDSLWHRNDPSNFGGHEDCIAWYFTSHAKIVDMKCSALAGFACEFVETPREALAGASWQRTPFKRTSYNPSSEFCHADLLQVKNAMHCVAAGMRAASCRHVLYNSKLRACRLLLFTDAQVEAEIETNADWVKFSVF